MLKALAEEGYVTPTPIQQDAIPHLLEGRDLLGIAQTGTGKTAAFALPILQRLTDEGRAREPKKTRVLVLAPTRELAIQTEDNFHAYGRYLPLRSACIFGGVGDKSQKEALARGVDILVATPGRLLDLAGQGAISFSQLEVFVLDEADRMLDMGFIHDIRRVLKLLPPERHNLFFSATMPDSIAELAGNILRDPVRVEVTPVSTPVERINQELYFIGKTQKGALLRHLLQSNPSISRAIVFSRTKHGANRISEGLEKAGITSAAIHGNKSQTRRQEALAGFRDGSLRVLVATDIAARGIDVEGITHVFNYDLPDVAETYVHRIGRTARAGADGAAISFCSSEERDELKQIERLLGHKLPVAKNPEGLEEKASAESSAKREPRQGQSQGRADRPHREPRKRSQQQTAEPKSTSASAPHRQKAGGANRGKAGQQQSRRRSQPQSRRGEERSTVPVGVKAADRDPRLKNDVPDGIMGKMRGKIGRLFGR